MEKLIIEEEKNTPYVVLDHESGQCTITGNSFPENSKKFYMPVLNWFESFIPDGKARLTFDFEFYYISSSSIISILEMIKRINEIDHDSCKVIINWYYDEDDEDIKKIGEDYAKLTNVEFNLISNDA